jgi:hypothetical protein
MPLTRPARRRAAGEPETSGYFDGVDTNGEVGAFFVECSWRERTPLVVRAHGPTCGAVCSGGKAPVGRGVFSGFKVPASKQALVELREITGGYVLGSTLP